MFIWLVVEDGPPDWGGHAVIKAFVKAKDAKDYIKKQRKKDDYQNQYLKVERYTLE